MRGACPHDCPDTCAWQVEVQDGVAVKLTGDREHPFTRGGLCAKVNGYLADRVYAPDRLLHPLRRTGAKGSGEFERVGWEEAIADIAGRLRGVIDEHGAEAVLPFNFAGTQGMVQWMSIPQRFFLALGASQLEQTVCGANGNAGVTQTQHTRVGMDPEAIVHSRFIVLWGTNTVVTNLHLWPFVQEARRAGAKVVVIDPVRTRTARAADWHVAPRPGTDAVLAYALMQVILAEELHDAAFVEAHATGFEALRKEVAAYPPRRAAAITGVPAEEIEALARAYATTRPAVIRTLVGMEHRRNGTATYRAVSCLPVLTGAWREPGGGLLGMVSGHMGTALRMEGLGVLEGVEPRSRWINMMRIGRALTEDASVRALFVFNANPAVTSPQQNLVLAGLARHDLFTVVHEHFLTDTARYADYVLPATTQVEQLDLMFSWGTLYVSLNRPAIEPVGEAISNTELFRRLAAAMGLTHPGLYESDEEIIRAVLDTDHPWAAGITYERLCEEGWAKLALPGDWTPARFDVGVAPLDDAPVAPPGFPLSLLSAKEAHHFLNSSYGGSPRHLRAEREPVLDVHADDAEPRGIGDGDLVRVFNAQGEVLARARVGDRVVAGMVSMPSGWWPSHSPGGRSVNALTPDGIAPVGRGGDFHDCFVEVAVVPAAISAGLTAAARAPAPTPR